MTNRIILAATLSLATFAAAHAQPADLPSETVSYADLNLHSDRGRERFYRRVTAAAERVCGASNGIAPLALRQLDRQCVKDAIKRAQPAMDAAGAIQLAAR